MVPRIQLADALSRPESRYAGVYLLIGEVDGEPQAYIGEGEDIAARIRSHDVNKDWWSSVVLVTVAANKLNKAHVRYLESRMIAEARNIGRVPLENGNNPALPSLSEADNAKMEVFLENLFVVLPAVRVDMFIKRTRTPQRSDEIKDISSDSRIQSNETSVDADRFVLQLKRGEYTANAILNEHGEFVVLVGSQARPL